MDDLSEIEALVTRFEQDGLGTEDEQDLLVSAYDRISDLSLRERIAELFEFEEGVVAVDTIFIVENHPLLDGVKKVTIDLSSCVDDQEIYVTIVKILNENGLAGDEFLYRGLKARYEDTILEFGGFPKNCNVRFLSTFSDVKNFTGNEHELSHAFGHFLNIDESRILIVYKVDGFVANSHADCVLKSGLNWKDVVVGVVYLK